MSYDYTRKVATNTVSNADIQERLLDLPASVIMQSTGDIFDPEFFLLDTKARVVYRREVFDQGADLPGEILVRDRRYGKDEIAEICKSAGLEILACGFVRAGNFEMVAQEQEDPTKEVLVVARKSLI